MNDAASRINACSRCGCPLAGNESYCSNCGRRLDARGRLARVLVAAGILIALGAAGTCVAIRSRGGSAARPSSARAPTREKARDAERGIGIATQIEGSNERSRA